MNVFTRTWAIVRSSLGVLGSEKGLVLYPMLSALSVVLFSVLVMGGGLVILSLYPELGQGLQSPGESGQADPTHAPWLMAALVMLLFLYYLATYTIVNYFMTALAGAALEVLQGRDPSFADGLRTAWHRRRVISAYSFIAATVATVLAMLGGKNGRVGAGSLLAGLGGLAWGVATFLVVPILAAKCLVSRPVSL